MPWATILLMSARDTNSGPLWERKAAVNLGGQHSLVHPSLTVWHLGFGAVGATALRAQPGDEMEIAPRASHANSEAARPLCAAVAIELLAATAEGTDGRSDSS
jgi:hypothetical protein